MTEKTNPSLRTFYLLVFTQIFSLIGSRSTGIAVGMWVFAETGDAAPLLIAAFFLEIPAMLGNSLSGFAADRWNRRQLIIMGDVGQALGTLLIFVSISSDSFQLWHLYLAMIIQGSFSVLQAPASSASITMLVPPQYLDRANGIRQVGFPLAGVVAPALAGTLYALIGLTSVFIFDLVTFAAAVGVVLMLHIPQPAQSAEGREASESLWKEISGGWRFLQSHRALLLLVVYLAFVFFMINGPLDTAIPYLSTINEDETVVGFLLAAMNLGAVCGAGIVALMKVITYRVPMLLAAYAFHGLLLIVYGITREALLLGPILFLMMLPLPLAGALFNTLLQRKSPPDMQGRIFGVTDQIFVLTTPLSFLITAGLVDRVLEPAAVRGFDEPLASVVGTGAGAGMGLLLVVTGIIVLAATLLIALVPGVRHIESLMPDYVVEEAD